MEDQLEKFFKPTVMTEGPLKGGYVTRLITRTNGDIDAFNADGVYGPGTEHIWQLYSPREHNGAKVSRVTFNKSGDVTGENPEGINWNEKPGVNANYTQITWQKDGPILKGNPGGVDGPGSRTLVAELREPFKPESGPFEGMTMRSFHTTPVQGGYKVKVMNPDPAGGRPLRLTDSGIIAENRILSPDEFRTFLEGAKVNAVAVAKLLVANEPELIEKTAELAEVIH